MFSVKLEKVILMNFDFPNEEYLVSCAKEALENGDPYEAKAWLITAKTLFPNNFGVQFEAYLIEKSARNVKEAAKCFGSLFQTFQEGADLWKEIQSLTTALRSDSGEPDAEFLREMFGHIPSEVQRQLLLMSAERSEDTMEHCRLLLLLLHRFPEAVSQHGPTLVDLLLTAEKHCHYQNAVNCYRKLLVCDILPLLGTNQVVVPPKQLLRLLHKSLEFFLHYLAAPGQLIEDLPEAESHIGDPWRCLFNILALTGQQLRWEINCQVFAQSSNKEVWWQALTAVGTAQQPSEEALLYSALACFLHSLHEYRALLGGDAPLALVELFRGTAGDPAPKRAKTAPALTAAREAGGQVVACFTMAARCYELLTATDARSRELTKMVKQLKLEAWLGGFSGDYRLYVAAYEEACAAEDEAHGGATAARRRHLRLACAHFVQARYALLAEDVYQIVSALPGLPPAAGSGSSLPPAAASGRHLHFLPLTRSAVLHYCVSMLVTALKKSHRSDLTTGHLLTLSQLDWPIEEELAMEQLNGISLAGSFSYSLFQQYIVNIDLLELFMYLTTEQGGSVQMDIMPSVQLASQRRISTRGADKGVKEDFKLAMKRQVARSNDPVDTLIIKFITTEHEAILRAIQA